MTTPMRATARSTGAVLAGLLVLAAAGTAHAQEVVLDAGATEVDLSGRVQLQAATSSCSDFPFEQDSPCTDQVPGLDMFTRRVRVSASVTINDFISAKVEPDYAEVSGVTLRDAYGRLTFGDGAKVQVGQFKRPFDGFNLVSSSQLLTVERDIDIPGVPGMRAASLGEFASGFDLASYDIGAMVFGTLADGRLDYHVGVFNGEPSSAGEDRNGGKQVVGRLTYRLSAGDLPLSVSAAGARSDRPFEGADDQPGVQASSKSYRDFELFAELGGYEPGPHLQAGVIFGDNPTEAPDGSPAIDPGRTPRVRDFASMYAWQVIGAYRFGTEGADRLEAVEPVFRVTRAEPNTDRDGDRVWAFTPGLNVYFFGRNKLQLNWDFATFDGDSFASVNSFKSQLQVYF